MKQIRVIVVYALPDAATEIELGLSDGSTVADALRSSGLEGRHPELDLQRCAIGVFGRRVEPSAVLSDGDRVEIYRPLFADPKNARRRRSRRRIAA
jgi:putative ubiquitin-RnfH superfamily antitoxin RatB of RatAB toxin-antitoxin module